MENMKLRENTKMKNWKNPMKFCSTVSCVIHSTISGLEQSDSRKDFTVVQIQLKYVAVTQVSDYFYYMKRELLPIDVVTKLIFNLSGTVPFGLGQIEMTSVHGEF